MLRLSAGRQRWATRAGCVLVLLLAVMPQVLYLGHPLAAAEPPAQAHQTGHEHHDMAAAEHANHCHVGPKSCAGGNGVVSAAPLTDVISVLTQGDGLYALGSSDTIHTFALYQRPEKPPRVA